MTSFGELYRRHAGDIYRVALWMCGNEAEAEDVTAETFMRAWVGVDDLRFETAKAYLLTIARNIVRKNRRRRKENGALDETLIDPSPDSERVTGARSELGRALHALQVLPEVDRAALLMRVEGEMSYREIALATGLSVAAAKVRVHRARMRLKGVMK